MGMRFRYSTAIMATLLVLLTGCHSNAQQQGAAVATDQPMKNPHYSRTDTAHLHVSDAEWERILPADLYHVAREQGTERAFTGKYWDADVLGTYYCAVCGNKLFRSDGKFASSCGWPSFFEAVRPDAVGYKDDRSWCASRCAAIAAARTSVTSSMTHRRPPPATGSA